MKKDVYRWWSRQKLKDEILKLKLTYNELFDAMLKTQEENNKLRKAYNICDEANIDLKEKIKALRKELNERSYVTLEENLTEANKIILTLLNTFAYPIGREDWTMEDIEVINRAEKFIKE